VKTETLHLKAHQNAELTAYVLDGSPEFSNIEARPVVLIFPGGAYRFTSDREAEPVAMAYLAEGFNAFVLRYSVGETFRFEAALQDAEEAIAMIRAHAEDWHTDPEKIAVAGFSAGGHLAAALGTIGKNKPNALILGYPCILDSMSESLAFPVPSVDKEVTAETPPVFLFSTFEDQTVPIENSIAFLQALNVHGIPFESHIFQKGKHGLSLAKPHTSNGLKANVDADVEKWFGLSVSWLHKVLGQFPANA